jgi:hypothetical protein
VLGEGERRGERTQHNLIAVGVEAGVEGAGVGLLVEAGDGEDGEEPVEEECARGAVEIGVLAAEELVEGDYALPGYCLFDCALS